MPLTIEIPDSVLDSLRNLPQPIQESVRDHLDRLAHSSPPGNLRTAFVVTGRGYFIAAEVLPEDGKLVVTSVRTSAP